VLHLLFADVLLSFVRLIVNNSVICGVLLGFSVGSRNNEKIIVLHLLFADVLYLL
jgi:hypothetical protein